MSGGRLSERNHCFNKPATLFGLSMRSNTKSPASACSRKAAIAAALPSRRKMPCTSMPVVKMKLIECLAMNGMRSFGSRRRSAARIVSRSEPNNEHSSLGGCGLVGRNDEPEFEVESNNAPDSFRTFEDSTR